MAQKFPSPHSPFYWPNNPILPKPGSKSVWSELPIPLGAEGLLYSELSQILETDQDLLVLTVDCLQAEQLKRECEYFLKQSDHPAEIKIFPDWEILPYDRFSPHQEIISARLKFLNELLLPTGSPRILMIPIVTFMQRIVPISFIQQHVFQLQVGQVLSPDRLKQRLVQSAYQSSPVVSQPGEFVVRGSVMDIFPMASDWPFRIDWFDQQIDSIRQFDPDNQRTFEAVQQIDIVPAKEYPTDPVSIERFKQTWRETFSGDPTQQAIYKAVSQGELPAGLEAYLPFFVDKLCTVLSYCDPNICIVHQPGTFEAAEQFWREIKQRHETVGGDERGSKYLPPAQLYIPPVELFAQLKAYRQIQLCRGNPKELGSWTKIIPLSVYPSIPDYLKSNPTIPVKFCIDQYSRESILKSRLDTLGLSGEIVFNPIQSSFQLIDSNIIYCCESDLTGHKPNPIQSRRLARYRQGDFSETSNAIRSVSDLEPNCLVVHMDHGIGRYLGLENLTVQDQVSEFLVLEYANQARIYVPIRQFNQVSRYTAGVDPKTVRLNQLGSQKWQKTKQQALEQVQDTAAELLAIYAKRAHQSDRGFVVPEPDEQYREFSEAFPFQETPDQLTAIQAVQQDLCAPKPMDRVICGDVGFGKTEVAMRAAFLVAAANRQVVMLVPTTLLAQQHYETFLDRFQGWPFRIEMLSRFKTKIEQQAILKKLEHHQVDILIGTHQVLSATVKFKQLGLLLIDEEHRFGVRQKEKLKSLRLDVNILTLTATPIPRTLSLAFSDLRDLTIMTTPPVARLSVKTFVTPFRKDLVLEAIQRELHRGGQVFFVHNEVETISGAAQRLAELVPSARIRVAHGQMRERLLEQTMRDFYHRRFDILVCSTIIETGIDIPTANTIMIHRADRFGLAQLHQLRGRVGRSIHQAYAFLFIPECDTQAEEARGLTSEARQRLDAMVQHQALGSGFALAMQDLEIRGAGVLLGDAQSGHIQALGYRLYLEILEQAVSRLKSGSDNLEYSEHQKARDIRKIEIDLPISALIPDRYLNDVGFRLTCYDQIDHAKGLRDLSDIQAEMTDRFGALPVQTQALFGLARLRFQCYNLGISGIKSGKQSGVIQFNNKPNIKLDRLIDLIQNQPDQFKLVDQQHLRFTLRPGDGSGSWEASDWFKYFDQIFSDLV